MTPEYIKNARLALGMTQSQFAFAVGVSERNVRRWESGDRNISKSCKNIIDMLLDRLDVKAG